MLDSDWSVAVVSSDLIKGYLIILHIFIKMLTGYKKSCYLVKRIKNKFLK